MSTLKSSSFPHWKFVRTLAFCSNENVVNALHSRHLWIGRPFDFHFSSPTRYTKSDIRLLQNWEIPYFEYFPTTLHSGQIRFRFQKLWQNETSVRWGIFQKWDDMFLHNMCKLRIWETFLKVRCLMRRLLRNYSHAITELFFQSY